MDIKPIEYTDLEKMLIQFHEDSMGIKYVKDYAFFLKRQMIEKACEWLKEQKEMVGISFQDDFIERFKKAMEEEK